MAGDLDGGRGRERMQLFDLNTMSGVSPGMRTQIMQRIYLRPRDEATAPGARWARLLWYAGPESSEQAASIEGATCRVQQQAETGTNRWQPDPFFTLDGVAAATVNRILQDVLQEHGFVLFACGACSNWVTGGARTADGLPLGRCTLPNPAGDLTDVPPILGSQSLLAPGCAHWARAAADPAHDPERAGASDLSLPRAAVLVKEEEARTRGLWSRMMRTLRPNRDGLEPVDPVARWHARLEERSGVGAGTEPCFACQGRIANLGALTVATDEDDKHTYSVWRCRVCHTTYLNSWIDRWERLDSLETEEIYYRLAPAQAVEALAVIDGVVGGEHPAGRAQRDAERAWFERFTADLPVLSHQRRQGR